MDDDDPIWEHESDLFKLQQERDHLQKEICQCVKEIGDPLFEHIYRFVNKRGQWTKEYVRSEVCDLVSRNVLRMKEDEFDHDWAYERGSNWRH